MAGVEEQVYITKLKHDNYYWCFPLEGQKEYAIHDVIDFVHNKVQGGGYRERPLCSASGWEQRRLPAVGVVTDCGPA